MNLTTGQSYGGFKLMSVKSVAELGSVAHIFEHNGTGARLLYLANDDDNKVFSITFRTPPSDSTGVAHIVEHSVLCGSRKFPLKEPFVELVKGSLNTFLNAMTYPDKTVYPVASRNDKDFRNLMDVYLDAVFFPRMRDDADILKQEGWHYELEDAAGELTYKGVVYNEMKGVFSSPDAILEHKMMATLFPDNAYGFESGGDPDVIPNLTHEAFAAFHSRYYHPSNSYIFLYGDMDILATLDFIHGEYLARFDRRPADSEIIRQEPFAARRVRTFAYPVSAGEAGGDRSYHALATALGRSDDRELYLAFQILAHLLLETPAAPLKQALIEAGVGKEVFGYFVESLCQPVFSVMVSGAAADAADRLAAVAAESLGALAEKGIDGKLLQASINIIEFKLREANYGGKPKGLAYNIKCLDTWLYDGDPLLHLAYEAALAAIKAGADRGGYFEDLIKRYLLDNTHQALITLNPQPGLSEQMSRETRQELAKYKAKLSEEDIARIIAASKQLRERQEAPDSPEALASIPLLELSDLTRQAEELPLEERAADSVPVLFHPLFTNGIVYVALHFDLRHIPRQDLPWVYLLADLLGKISTERYSFADLANEVNSSTGGVAFDLLAYPDKERDDLFQPRFRMRVKSLLDRLPQAMSLVGEIGGRTAFGDHRRLKELIVETKAAWDTGLVRRGQQIVASRVLSYFSPSASFNEAGQFTYYQFLATVEKQAADAPGDVAAKLQDLYARIFRRDSLVISLTGEEASWGVFTGHLPRLTEALANGEAGRPDYQFQPERRNEGLMTSGKVQYVAKGANFRRLGSDYHGSMKVLETILRYDYLWNRIRVQGGAYGAFAQFERTGNMVFGSYRDPNLGETISVYDGTAQFLRSFDVSPREMTKYIIGTMIQLDAPLTPQMKGEKATMLYFRGITQADIQMERDEALSTRVEDIRRLAPLVEKAMADNYLCVLGSEEKIKSQQQTFGQLISTFV